MNNLKLLRTEKKLTMRELAEKVGICYTTISSLENGKRPFNLDHLQRLSSFFNVSYDYILGKSNERTNTIQVIDMTNSKDGVDLNIVSKRAGHSSISITMNHYWHLFKGDEERALKGIKWGKNE